MTDDTTPTFLRLNSKKSKRSLILKTTLISLFTLNFLYLFLLHPHVSPSPPSPSPPSNPLPPPVLIKPPPSHSLSSTSYLKPWPAILPSYLPWTPLSLPPTSPSHTPSSSCEAYFGNGFSKTLNILPRGKTKTHATSWLKAHYNPTLKSSVWEGGRVRMDASKIRMSRGGEVIKEVIGRSDDEELPVFEPGAFRVVGDGSGEKLELVVKKEVLDEYLPQGEVLRHTMRELVGSIQVVGEHDDNFEENFHCSEWIEEPTLLLTRFEYANVFHTYTDWYSAYVSSRVTGLPMRPNVVFVDGHSKTQLEETWEALFSGIRFAKNFTNPVCFRHAIFVPLGYETAWFKGLTEPIDCQGASAQDLWANPDDRKTARLSEFGEMIKAAFDFPLLYRQKNPRTQEHNVLFVRREDYLAHPRHGGKVESRLSNEQEVYESLKRWAAVNHTDCKVNLINGLFAHMTMKEQIRAIQDASVIIGAHGAGLTHVVSASPKTVILEIISSQYRRPHFQYISQWKGLDYHPINLPTSSADPKEVIAELKKILKSIGC